MGMASYRLPTGMASYDVGIRYNGPFKEHMLSLHDNNEKNLYSKTSLYLNKEGRCQYKIYFRNNTCLRSEILIFVNHSDVVVYVYPEKEDMLWHHRFGYVRSNKHYVYKFKLTSCLDLKNQGYFTKSC